MRNTLYTFLLLILAFPCVAQDLTSQRGESQQIDTLLGKRVDHNGLIINPTPQQLQRCGGEIDIAGGIALKGKSVEFVNNIDFLTINRKGLPLRIEYGEKQARKHNVKLCEGAYRLAVSSQGIDIVAYDATGAFYALQTLRQIVLSPASQDGKIEALRIYDWPDLPCRGVVEGFYGTPWSHQVRLSLIEVYGMYKMNYYVYGPKDDPYHSSPYWREPYPADQARNIHELVEACNRNRVRFVWAVHPGQDIQWNETDYQNLLRKFDAMYQLGVRAFAIHFDDISGEGANPFNQIALLNRLNEEFVHSKGDVAPLIVCPTDYTRLWANPTPQGSLVHYGATLHPSVDVFWTGDAVCSNLTDETMEWVNERIKRPALFWWNYPVTDYVRHIVMQGPVYGLSSTMTVDKVRGLLSNPMEHGEASKLALYCVADYTWNVTQYNPIDSWERALHTMAPEVYDAYRTFAIHSCDTETGYRRLESWETQTFTFDSYTPQRADTLLQELLRIEAVPLQMEDCQNKALLAELRPWLTQLGLLASRCRMAIEAMQLYLSGEKAAFWDAYVDNLMTAQETGEYNAHRVGTMKLYPFYQSMMEEMAAHFYHDITGSNAAIPRALGTYPSAQALQSRSMFDNDTTTYYHSGAGQRTNHYVAVDMGFVQPIHHIYILQGRNSVDDCDYYDNAILEYSIDNTEWLPLTQPLVQQYRIEWEGEPVMARYVRLRKLESRRTNWLAIRSFDINPVSSSMYHLDNNPFTALEAQGTITITPSPAAEQCILLMGKITTNQAQATLIHTDGTTTTIPIDASLITLPTTHIGSIQLGNVNTLYEVVFI